MGHSVLGIISANYKVDALEALTESRTIATIPFGGRYRLIDFALSNCVNSGIRTIGLITPYYYRSIMDHVGAGKPWGLAKKTGGLFILPGTVYGDRNAKSRILLRDIIRNQKILERSHSEYVLFSDTSVVMNCNIRDFVEAHAKSKADISLMYKKEKGKANRSYLNIKENGSLDSFTCNEKNAENLFLGYYIISRALLFDIINWYGALDNYDLIDVIKEHLDKFKVNTYEYTGYAEVIDTIKDYKKASNDLLEHKYRCELFEQERIIYTKIQDEAPAIFKPSASIKKSLIAAGCVIEGTVENSIVFRSSHIEKGAVVKNSIIMQRATIEVGATVINAICDKYSHISSNSHIEGSTSNPIVIKKNQTV